MSVMTEERVFDLVVKRIGEMLEICHRKNWAVTTEPYIGNPADEDDIVAVEMQIGKIIPVDLRNLYKFSRHVTFSYQFEEPLSEEFPENFSGEIYWNLDTLPEQYENMKGWIEAFLDPEFSDAEEMEMSRGLYENKFPLIDVPNGDLIVVNTDPSEVVYYSHEDSDMHGKVLGGNLWSFLEFHSRIGFAGSEDWQLEPFFDHEKNIMVTSGEKVERFIKLLEG